MVQKEVVIIAGWEAVINEMNISEDLSVSLIHQPTNYDVGLNERP